MGLPYVDDAVELGGGRHVIVAAVAAVSLGHQTLDLIRLGQLALSFLLLFVRGVGLQLMDRRARS